MSALLDRIEAIAEKELEPAGIEVVDVERLTESGRKVLRVYIDKPGGVTLTDCQEASRLIDPALDREIRRKNRPGIPCRCPHRGSTGF